MAVLAFSILNEAIIEYLFGNVEILRPYLPLLSLAVAILLVFIYQVSFFNLMFGAESNSPFLDFLLTGFIISRVSNYVNDFVQKFFESK
ncbi:hypothetical protein A3H40_01365 [Candidatus Daviesbacteria bacterium RIFCSPLOWO2_02_FULL_38_15]|uniref:Uncharacterized protein n=1 Tax=Candidatus Daviesbacteria bacterium RIFCSPLOWO2_02_FULL_38_15 TaxID=1797794 RepID=A0A1F5N1V0_9BACT|nr:MAG: hypothetical protein A3H40_01365 [Candidatus Daviesbacteria bacterium RIFCSPLOWO2_02_FULL_38_15]